MPQATAQATSALTPEGVQAFSRQREEPAFLLERRLRALSAFHALPLPGPTDEIWRRVKLGKKLDLEAAVVRAPSEALCALRGGDVSAAQKGVFWGPVEQAAAEKSELLKAKWATEVYPAGEHGAKRRGGKFHALNQALFDSGYVLHVPRNVRVESPHEAEFRTRGGRDGLFPHNLIVLEEGAEATVIERFVSAEDGPRGLCNPQTEILVGPNARLHYILLQYTGREVLFIGAQRVKLARDARVTFASAHLGGGLSKDFIEAELAGPGGEAVLYALYYGLGGQQIHLDTWQHHVAPHCHSNLLFKGVLDEQARAVYRGMIHLEPEAQQTDAYQQNRTLLLSDGARVHSIPGLEILANDVKCSHGATAGQIDPLMLFYLRSRGLTEFEARKMIVDGFLEEVLETFGRDEIAAPLRERLSAKMGGLEAQARLDPS